MKTYTITAAQLTQWLEAVSYGATILSGNDRGGTFSRAAIIKKLEKVQKDLQWLEFEG